MNGTLAQRIGFAFWECDLFDVPSSVIEKVTAEIYELLEEAVGRELASLCNDAQLEEYTEILERGDDSAASAWLELNVPFYRLIVQKHVDAQIARLIERLGAIR